VRPPENTEQGEGLGNANGRDASSNARSQDDTNLPRNLPVEFVRVRFDARSFFRPAETRRVEGQVERFVSLESIGLPAGPTVVSFYRPPLRALSSLLIYCGTSRSLFAPAALPATRSTLTGRRQASSLEEINAPT